MRCLVGLVWVLLLAHGLATQARGSNPQAETVSVEAVGLTVQALDAHGNCVEDLGLSDFTVREDGVVQSVLLAQRVVEGHTDGAHTARQGIAGSGRRFVLLFDLTFVRPQALLRARQAALEFGLRWASSDRQIAVFTLSATAGLEMLLNFSSDPLQVRDAISNVGSPKGDRFVADSAALVRVAPGESPMRPEGAPALDAGPSDIDMTLLGEDGKRIMNEIKRGDVSSYRGMVRGYLETLRAFATTINVMPGIKVVLFFSSGFDAKAILGETAEEASAQAEMFARRGPPCR